MLILNFFIVVTEIVFWASDHSKVRGGLFGKSDWDFHSQEFLEVNWVLHFFLDDAFLHLPDILFLHNSQEMFECRVNLVWVKLIAFSDRLAQEVESSFL